MPRRGHIDPPDPRDIGAAEWRSILSSLPAGDPDRSAILSNLSIRLRIDFEETGDPRLIHEAVDAARAGLAEPGLRRQDTTLLNFNLCIALQILYGVTGVPGTLNEAIAAGRAAVTAVAPGDSMHGIVGAPLAMALQESYRRTADPATLADAVEHMRAAVAASDRRDPMRYAELSNLAQLLHLAYETTGDPASLDEAIELMHAAIAEAPPRSPDRAGLDANLGAMLQSRHVRESDGTTLADAVAAARQSLAALPPGHPRITDYRNNLGNALRLEYERTGELSTLVEAATVQRAALKGTPNPQAAMQANLCATLTRLYERTRDRAALTEAVQAARAAVERTPPDHADRPGFAGNLSGVLHRAYRATGDRALLDEGLAAAAEAAGDPRRGQSWITALMNRTGLLLDAYDLAGDPGYLEQAAEVSRACVEATTGGDPYRCAALTLRGRIAFARYRRTGHITELDECRSALDAAAAAVSSPVADRIAAARGLEQAATEAGDPAAALDAMERAVALMPLLSAPALRRSDRLHRLGGVPGFAAQAAAAALAARRPRRALELLEQTRGVLLAETLSARGAASDLRSAAPDLAVEFEALRRRIARLDDDAVALGVTPEPGPSPRSTLSGAAALSDAASRHALGSRRAQAVAEWDGLLARIRARPGLAGFLATPTAAEIQAAVGRGPIVVVTAARNGGDALILTADPLKPVIHVPLPNLTEAEARRHAELLRTAHSGARDLDAESAPTQLADPTAVLAWLWDAVAEPVFAALKLTRPPAPGHPWPRIWWCPVGVMAFLPLHAAGYHAQAEAVSECPRAVLDLAVSSYTSTIRALSYVAAVRTPAHCAGPGDPPPGPFTASPRPALLVSMPQTKGAAPLPGVAAETRALAALLAGATVLSGPQATATAVAAALPTHAIAHFACHGLSDRDDPSSSRLLLWDDAAHPLTVGQIARMELADAELAYLSACSTTDTTLQFADEALHITSAFQLAGFRHVIGTLWPVDDAAASFIAQHVYERLTEDGTHPPASRHAATALHHAVRILRSRYPETPLLWSAHLHFGP